MNIKRVTEEVYYGEYFKQTNILNDLINKSIELNKAVRSLNKEIESESHLFNQIFFEQVLNKCRYLTFNRSSVLDKKHGKGTNYLILKVLNYEDGIINQVKVLDFLSFKYKILRIMDLTKSDFVIRNSDPYHSFLYRYFPCTYTTKKDLKKVKTYFSTNKEIEMFENALMEIEKYEH